MICFLEEVDVGLNDEEQGIVILSEEVRGGYQSVGICREIIISGMSRVFGVV